MGLDGLTGLDGGIDGVEVVGGVDVVGVGVGVGFVGLMVGFGDGLGTGVDLLIVFE